MKKILITIMSLITLHSMAQEKAKLPGNTSLPSSKEDLEKIANLETGTFKYAVADYFSKPMLSGFHISPDGKYISYRQKDEHSKRHIYVKDVATEKVTKVVEETDELIRNYWWANNERIMFLKDKGGNENYHLYGVNIDGSNLKELTPFDGVRVEILNELKEQKDFVLISMNKDNLEYFEPYKLNIVSGELTKIYENKDLENPIISYDFDKDGKLRAITKQVNGNEYHLMYRTDENSPFQLVEVTNWKTNFGIISFNYNSKNPHEAYCLSNLNSDKSEIIRYDLKEKKVLEVLYKNDTYDIANLQLSRKRNYVIDAYSYEGEKEVEVPISDTYKKIHEKLNGAFANKTFSIYDATDEEDKFLIYVNSDKLYGQVHLLDMKLNTVTKMLDIMPQLKEEDMAEIRPFSFKSRDGLTLHGYLTIPKGAEGKQNPLVVNPHGGPYGPRDSWGFNPETQLFASRGYVTIQVNYRGSGGYGKAFHLAGAKQIGRNMLKDLEDGVQYAIDLGIADKNKIAIYGGSYGGLATLGSLVKTPQMYSCGVDYVGVSNLFTFMNTIPPYWKPYLAQIHEQWYDPTNAEEKKIMEAASPALNTDKIVKPLLIVQGANDPRVNIDEADQMVVALRKRGVEVPYMVKYDEGHGFGHEENQIEFYKTMLGFFSKHLKGK